MQKKLLRISKKNVCAGVFVINLQLIDLQFHEKRSMKFRQKETPAVPVKLAAFNGCF